VKNPHAIVQPLQLWGCNIKFDRIKNNGRQSSGNWTLRVSVRPSTKMSSSSSKVSASSPNLDHQWVDIDINGLKETPQLIAFILPTPSHPPYHIYIQLGHIHSRYDDQWYIITRLFCSLFDVIHEPIRSEMENPTMSRVEYLDYRGDRKLLPPCAMLWLFTDDTNEDDTKRNVMISRDNIPLYMHDNPLKLDECDEHTHWMLFPAGTIRYHPLDVGHNDNMIKLPNAAIRVWSGISTASRSSDRRSVFIFTIPPTKPPPASSPSLLREGRGDPSTEIEINALHRLIVSRRAWQPHISPDVLSSLIISPSSLLRPLVDLIMLYYYEDRRGITAESCDSLHPSYRLIDIISSTASYTTRLSSLELYAGVTLVFAPSFCYPPSPSPVYLRSYANTHIIVTLTNNMTYYFPIPNVPIPDLRFVKYSSSLLLSPLPPSSYGSQPLSSWLPLPTSLSHPSSSYLDIQCAPHFIGSTYEIIIGRHPVSR
jgi:hypothetical protein